jgi:hypothetical protein
MGLSGAARLETSGSRRWWTERCSSMPYIALRGQRAGSAPLACRLPEGSSSGSYSEEVVRMPRLRLISIVCRKAQDFGGTDKTYIVANSERVWGPVQMRSHHTQDLTAQVTPIPFDGTIQLQVWEQDFGAAPNRDDLLGSHDVPATLLGSGVKELQFKGSGGDYSVFCEVRP